MNINGEYSISYNIYTMFDVYKVKISHHNLITNNGFDFFLKKWYTDDDVFQIELGYYNDNKFYAKKSIDGRFSEELTINGTYSKTTNYIDRDSNRQYRFDGTNFVDFAEKLDRICIGNYPYNEKTSVPSETDMDLYSFSKEFPISDFKPQFTKLIMTYELESSELNGTTEIGVKTNHGRLVSHDIHAPYNFPVTTNVVLEYVFNLKE